MKFGFRTPSLTKRIAARTSPKRILAHKVGLKAPRGMGGLTNPKKAAYNKIYNKTTIDPLKGLGRVTGSPSGGVLDGIVGLISLIGGIAVAIWFARFFF